MLLALSVHLLFQTSAASADPEYFIHSHLHSKTQMWIEKKKSDIRISARGRESVLNTNITELHNTMQYLFVLMNNNNKNVLIYLPTKPL